MIMYLSVFLLSALYDNRMTINVILLSDFQDLLCEAGTPNRDVAVSVCRCNIYRNTSVVKTY